MIIARRRAYVAHPQASYGTEHERACLAALGELLPGVELFDPNGRYPSDVAWLRAWPRVLDSLAGLVVFGAEDGTVGTGCWREIGDALSRSLPLAVLDGAQLVELAGVRLNDPPFRTPRSVGTLKTGRAYEPGEYAACLDAVARQRARREAAS